MPGKIFISYRRDDAAADAAARLAERDLYNVHGKRLGVGAGLLERELRWRAL